MKLYTVPCYNPYYVEINGKDYCIDSISVFNESGVIIKNPRGWFGSNNDMHELVIDCDCVRKMKVDFKCKTAFVAKSNDTTWANEARYDLYIPNSVMDISEPVYEKVYSDTMIRKSAKSPINSKIVFESFAPIVSDISNIKWEIRATAESIAKMFDNYSELETVAKRLIELKKLYDAEKVKLSLVDAKSYAKSINF